MFRPKYTVFHFSSVFQTKVKSDFINAVNTCSWIPKIVSHKCLAAFCCVSLKDNKIIGQIMSRSVYRYNVSLCYLCVSLTVSVVSVKRQEVTETAKSVTETSRTYRNFTMAVLTCRSLKQTAGSTSYPWTTILVFAIWHCKMVANCLY